jgi:hypothetical protein
MLEVLLNISFVEVYVGLKSCLCDSDVVGRRDRGEERVVSEIYSSPPRGQVIFVTSRGNNQPTKYQVALHLGPPTGSGRQHSVKTPQ